MRRIVALAALLIFACAAPQPTPTPPVGPADLFTGKIFNCHLAVVAVERGSAVVDVKRCLLGNDTANPQPAACLVAQAGQYAADTVACVARDLGASANAAVLAGSTDPTDSQVANAARDWIRAEGLGLR